MNSFQLKLRYYAALPLGLKSMILSSFAVSFGGFMITPFLAIFLSRNLGLGAEAVGWIVALATFVQFGGSAPAGLVAEALGLKRTMVLALSLRVLGALLLASSIWVPGLLVPGVAINAASPALYLPANRAYVVSAVSRDMRSFFLSISNAALNAGMALGPLLAALLIEGNPVLLFSLVAAIFFFVAVIHQATIQDSPLPRAKPATNSAFALTRALQTAWRPLALNMLGFYVYFYFQNFLGLYASTTGKIQVFSWALVINFTALFILQPAASRWIATRTYRGLMSGSFVTMGCGISLISLGTTPLILIGTFIMTLGQGCLFLRGELEVVERLSDSPAIAFGLQRLAAGVGGLMSGVVAGQAFAHFKAVSQLGHFWMLAAIQCPAIALLCFQVTGSRSASQSPLPAGSRA